MTISLETKDKKDYYDIDIVADKLLKTAVSINSIENIVG